MTGRPRVPDRVQRDRLRLGAAIAGRFVSRELRCSKLNAAEASDRAQHRLAAAVLCNGLWLDELVLAVSDVVVADARRPEQYPGLPTARA